MNVSKRNRCALLIGCLLVVSFVTLREATADELIGETAILLDDSCADGSGIYYMQITPNSSIEGRDCSVTLRAGFQADLSVGPVPGTNLTIPETDPYGYVISQSYYGLNIAIGAANFQFFGSVAARFILDVNDSSTWTQSRFRRLRRTYAATGDSISAGQSIPVVVDCSTPVTTSYIENLSNEMISPVQHFAWVAASISCS